MATAGAASSPGTRLRVLCLHGFRTNIQVMQDQTRALREVLGPNVEYIYLNGPFEAEGESDPMIEERYAKSAPFYEWWRIQLINGGDSDINSAETSAMARATVEEGNEWYMRYGQLEETLAFMDEQLHRIGPVDVVVGFSQGSVLATVLSNWYLLHHNTRWWKLAICVCGVRVAAVNCRSLFETPDGKPILVPIPSVHIIGKEDPLFLESHRLVKMYDPYPVASPTERIVMEHDEGHKFPSLKAHKAFYDELLSIITKHCGDFSTTSTVAAPLSKL